MSHVKVDTEVLIVGAGPIGLILACALAYHKVPFRIIEQKEGPSTDSKAHNLIARSQELLQSIGALVAIQKQAYPSTEWEILLNQNQLTRLSLNTPDTKFAPWLFSGQSVFEDCFNAYLTERGHKVERGQTFESLTESADFVTASIANAPDVRARYLVGADGVKGSVRKAIGLDFSFKEMKGKATRQIDARLHWRRPTDFKKVWFFLYGSGFAGILPVWKDRYRLFFLEDQEAMPARAPTLGEMESRAREVTGDHTLTLSDPSWFSYGTFKCGVSPEYGRGRIFLAGDAGHDALPIGGQGMNTGVHDAIGLSWRLAMRLKLGGCAAVMDSYSHERQSVHATKNEQQVSGFNKMVYRSKWSDVVLATLARLAPSFISRIFGIADLQQLDVAYPGSPLSQDDLPSHPKAGARAPDTLVVDEAGQSFSIHQLLNRKINESWEWTLLDFDGGLRRTVATTQSSIAQHWIKTLFLNSNPQSADAGSTAPTFYDFDRETHKAFGLEKTPALILIRPDGHIAYRGPSHSARELEAYLKRITA